jgi:ABC-type transport system substrate-binding protein
MSYWQSITKHRVNRRRALALTGGAAAGAALLAACGGGDDGGGQQTSSLVVKAEDSSKEAKRGGIYKTFISTDAGSWDPHVRGAWFGTLGAVLYSRLTIVKPGLGEPSAGEIGGDLAESWEFSGDGLTATFKLRQNAKWHPVAPVNARGVDAQDVVASWNRWANFSATRATVANAANPDAPVVSMTAADNRTVVVKLAFPSVTLPSLISASVGQAFHIMPREFDGGYDPRNVSIGSGPFYVSQHVSSSHIHVKRNPGYYDSERPYVDGMEYPIITEYATGLAAFKSGQLFNYSVRPEEVVGVKRDVPDLNMYQTNIALPASATTVFFGYKANDKGMFRDKRLRQAYSMSLDRDLFTETWFNLSEFTSQGLPVDTAWSSAISANEYTGWWLDPQGKDYGPNAKFFKHDLAEAKKLVAAAGFANGVEYKSTRAGGNYGPEYDRQIDVIEAMAADTQFKPAANVVNYQNDLIPNYQSVRGDFEGIGWMLRPQSSSDPIEKLAEYCFSGSGPNFIGFDPDGKGNLAGDPVVDDLIRKSRVERDTAKRQAMMHDIDRHIAGQMYLIRPLSGATGFQLAWPAVRSFSHFDGDPRDTSTRSFYTWLDPTKKPLGTA